jgi:hypothetical protein
MFHKFVLGAVSAMGLVGGMAALPAAADAHPPVIVHHRVEYEVLYRRHNHWHVAGTYCDGFEARRVAESYRCRGYFVEVRPV